MSSEQHGQPQTIFADAFRSDQSFLHVTNEAWSDGSRHLVLPQQSREREHPSTLP
jgi:hypothetical protein